MSKGGQRSQQDKQNLKIASEDGQPARTPCFEIGTKKEGMPLVVSRLELAISQFEASNFGCDE
jgi:hypothetical protein